MAPSENRPRQVAVIPARRMDDGVVRVCLIRRKTSQKWSIPKGYIEPGQTHTQAALAEAHEEAGLNGRLTGDAIGTYEYDKGPIRLTVAVYVMEVIGERRTWQEMRWRERRWYSIEEAGARLTGHEIRAVYDRVAPILAAMWPDTPREK